MPERNGEDPTRSAPEQRHEHAVSFFNGAEFGQAVLKKGRSVHDEHRRVDRPAMVIAMSHVYYLITEDPARWEGPA